MRLILLGLLVAIGPPATAAAVERITAVVYSCVAAQSCSEGGDCMETDHKLTVIERTRQPADADTGPVVTEYLVAGPTLGRAGAGLFFAQPVIKVEDVDGPLDVLRQDHLMEQDRTLFHRALTSILNDRGDRYYTLRPAREIRGLSGARVVTEFTCKQALF